MPDQPQESAQKTNDVVVIRIHAPSRSEAKRLKEEKAAAKSAAPEK
jgi:hypothetical protein